ncbi:MAG: tRNA (guanosine(46)-N7)-methyltransferase TrmB [Paludibacteraceae bacterium]|nr:tRNA (guanosine(46)-N7)-methyltransferase TrmB [Paludibacteraceae bacterium]
MSKNKLAKFALMATYPNVFQPEIKRFDLTSGPCESDFALRGKWASDYFQNTNPIVIELGCGHGDYAVGLARRFPEKNFIGVDIKGARMYSGAKESLESGLKNVAFLRTRIELISLFFASDEVSEIWITFPDPQMKKRNKRLTSSGFLKQYARFLRTDGVIHLKTDSNFLYTYTMQLLEKNGIEPELKSDDLYESPVTDGEQQEMLTSIQTHYEKQWLERGLSIKYVRFRPLRPGTDYEEPEEEIEFDEYRSYGREKRTPQSTGK